MLYLVVCCSYYYSNILFPHHLPKIRNSVLHGALSRNVMIRSSAHVQLQWNHSAQMQFNARQKAMQISIILQMGTSSGILLPSKSTSIYYNS